MKTAIWFLPAASFLVALVAGFICGYDRGVKDTEERWSEAVARADSRR